MTAGPWTLTNEFRSRLWDGTFGNLTAANAVKVAFFQSTSNIGTVSTTYSALTNEVAAANGYATGGVAATLAETGSPNSALNFTAPVTIAASGGSVVGRFLVCYHVSSGHIVAYCLADATPADVTITTGNSLNITTTNPVVSAA